MKQALIDADGLTVLTVRVLETDEHGGIILPENDPYTGPFLLLADDVYCGAGMLWDQSTTQALFTYPADLSTENSSLWTKVKNFFLGQ